MPHDNRGGCIQAICIQVNCTVMSNQVMAVLDNDKVSVQNEYLENHIIVAFASPVSQ